MTEKTRVASALLALTLIASLAGCGGPEGAYRGGVFIPPGQPLTLSDQYSFQFLDRWRISHSWLSGSVDISYCQYSQRDNGRGEDRFFEVNGRLKIERVSGASGNFGKKFISNSEQFIYGINPSTGAFKGYLSFCGHGFLDISTGMSVLLIRPDPANGTDRWVVDAKPVMINGLQWLRKDTPIKFDARPDEGEPRVEVWVLKIPDTPYWLVMRTVGYTGTETSTFGINRNPAKYANVLNLFHQMIASVRIEPIKQP
jgi:hypothetical protein